MSVRISPAGLDGDLTIPDSAAGVVVFAHGSGSSRLSARNRLVAGQLQRAGLGTLLFDLLTREEERSDERTGQFRFDIEFLAKRLIGAIEWLKSSDETRSLRIGLFGASTGAGAALAAAARSPQNVSAVVSRGGRPDLAGRWLVSVKAPTLLIVGGDDVPVIQVNRSAFAQLPMREKRMEIVPGASHLFEEPGALEQVATLASEWFGRYLR